MLSATERCAQVPFPPCHERGIGVRPCDVTKALLCVTGDFEIGIQNCQKQCWAYGPCTAIEFNHISGTCTLRQMLALTHAELRDEVSRRTAAAHRCERQLHTLLESLEKKVELKS